MRPRQRTPPRSTYTPLRDVPQAITVVTRAMIADQSMQSLADVMRYVPGVGVAQGEGNRDTAVFRGNSSTCDFFVDGIRDDVQYFRDLYNVERVEALKGPNAMIFGRGGAGGVINRTTRQADWTSAREAIAAGRLVRQPPRDGRRAAIGSATGRPCARRPCTRTPTATATASGSSATASTRRSRCASARTRSCAPATSTSTTSARPIAASLRSNGRPFETDAVHVLRQSRGQCRRDATVNALRRGLEHRFSQRVSLRNRTRLRGLRQVLPERVSRGVVQPDGANVPISAYNNATGRAEPLQPDGSERPRRAPGGSGTPSSSAPSSDARPPTTSGRRDTSIGAATIVLGAGQRPAPSRCRPSFRQSATDADNDGVATVAALLRPGPSRVVASRASGGRPPLR